MSKSNKKKKTQGQQFLSPEKFMQQKMRSLEIGDCYVTDSLWDYGEGHVLVTRKHTGGKVSLALFFLDVWCVGLKDSFYKLRLDEKEYEDFLDKLSVSGIKPCSYEEAHNIVYGAVEFAREAGIEPDKSFGLTQYMLEEDDDRVPLIEYDFGKDGKHCLVAQSELEASKYLPQMKKTLGDDFTYTIVTEDDSEKGFNQSDSDEPVSLQKLMGDMQIGDIKEAAEIYGFEVPSELEGDTIEHARQWLAKQIIDHPKDVLSKLPSHDLVMIEEIVDNDSSMRTNTTFTVTTSVMLHILSYSSDGEHDYFDLPVEFRRAFTVDLVESILHDARILIRFVVEQVLLGLTNLYGVITRREYLDYIRDGLAFDQDGDLGQFYQWVRENSALIAFYDNDPDVPDSKMLLHSPFMWEDVNEFRKHVRKEVEQKKFTPEEIKDAGLFPTLDYPNPSKQKMLTMLRKDFHMSEDDAKGCLFDLWIRAQHEEDENFEESSVQDYIATELMPQAHLGPKELGKSHRLISTCIEYCNDMPLWILRGHTPREIGILG